MQVKLHAIRRLISLALGSAFAVVMPAAGQDSAAAGRLDFSGYTGTEIRGFPSSPLDGRQRDVYLSLLTQPEVHFRSKDGRQGFDLVAFLRYDASDGKRSHFDVRELSWHYSGEWWAVRAGIRKVFWGTTESQHLVDIINQTDLVENFDGEEKLGQPMLNFALVRRWGSLDIFVLPGFRERTFPGRSGRLRTQPHVATDEARFESSNEHRHVDMAVRFARSIGEWDLGLAHFSGTGREPLLLSAIDRNGQALLIPFYEQVDQDSIDIQTTQGQLLLKLEAVHRRSRSDEFYAAAAGFEYTLVGLFGTTADLGVIAEYLYDDRGHRATTPFQDDLFTGLRLTLNDAPSSEALVGVAVDRHSQAVFFNLEASRRFGQRWKLSLEARAFSGVPSGDRLYSVRRDDYASLELLRYF